MSQQEDKRDSESRWAEFFARMPDRPASGPALKSARKPADDALVFQMSGECRNAQAEAVDVYRDLELSPSWKSVVRDAVAGRDSFQDMQDAREHFNFWVAPWIPGCLTPAQALLRLAIEANRQAFALAEWGDSESAIELYFEGQAYLLELQAEGAAFREGHKEMKKRGTAEARTTRLEFERERKIDLICGSLSELSRDGRLTASSTGQQVISRLQEFWEERKKELGFDPWEMELHIRKLIADDPALAEEFRHWAGVKGELVF